MLSYPIYNSLYKNRNKYLDSSAIQIQITFSLCRKVPVSIKRQNNHKINEFNFSFCYCAPPPSNSEPDFQQYLQN